MVPILQCGLLRSNFALPMTYKSLSLLLLSVPPIGKSTGCFQTLERVKGIEPSSSAWKAVALPLSYTRLIRVAFSSSFFACLAVGGGGWFRTNVGVANGFTVRPL